jgi:ubiquinone/menaquinone biosynthesis C-methylase UbiE
MKESSENKVRDFYDQIGWNYSSSEVTMDAQLWEDLRSCAVEYVKNCRRKLLKYLPKQGEFFLDAASGPIQYPEYLEYSNGFSKRVCVDISQKALDGAKAKLGFRGEYVCSSMLELPFPENYFDAVVSLHTIYHIDKDRQADAVNNLVRVAKPDVPIIIVYANPKRLLLRLKKWIIPKTKLENENSSILYYYAHPLNWWNQFKEQCQVKVLPWRSLTAKDARLFVPNNYLGKLFLRLLLKFETHFPYVARQLGAYPMIILKKEIS